MRILISLFLLGCTPMMGQMRSGTIIVLSQSQSKLIVAADSRVIVEHQRPEESFCKITLLGPRLVFAAAGLVADSSPLLPEGLRFAAIDIAKEAVRDFRPVEMPADFPMPRTVQIANQFGNAMANRLRQGVPVRLEEWLKGMHGWTGDHFLEGIFAGEEPDGTLTIAVSFIDYDPPRPGWTTPIVAYSTMVPTITDKVTWIDAYGMPTVVESYLRGDSEFSKQIASARRGPTDKFDESIPIQLVERTIQEDQTVVFPGGVKGVGGAIDAVKLVPGKDAEWIAHPNCQCAPPPLSKRK